MRTASLPQPSDGLILVIGPRLEGHSVHCLVIQTHLSHRFFLTVSFLVLRWGGSWSQINAYASNMLHRVDPITEGGRGACVGWDQSFVQATNQRLIIHELDQLRDSLTAELSDSPDPEKLARTCQDLLRMWAEVWREPCLVPIRRKQCRDRLNTPWAGT